MKTKYVQAVGFLEYAKVFEQNRDLTSVNADVQKKLNKLGGEYSVNFYPETEEEMQSMLNKGLSDPMFGGYPRFKDGNEEFGCGKFVTFKRGHIHPSVEDFSGPPEVVHWSEAKRNEPWDYDEDGLLGNGTKALIKFTLYGTGATQSVRLVKVGVIDHVVYDKGDLF